MAASLLLAVVLVLMPSSAQAIDPGEMLADPAQEARTQSIGKQLRCMVCDNQSIFDSNAGLAHDLRMVVRERVVAGDSDEAAIDYIVARYGDYVLLNPPVKPETYILWLAPAALLLAAAFAARRYTKRRGDDSADHQDLSAEDRAAARRLLEGDSA